MRARPAFALLLACVLVGWLPELSPAQGLPSPPAFAHAAAPAEVRSVVVTGVVEVCTSDLDGYRVTVRESVEQAGGYVASVSGTAVDGLVYTLRVPTDVVPHLLDALQAPADDVLSVRRADRDVTQRLEALQTLVDQKRRTVQRYADVLTHARVAGDVLAMEERLGQIRAELQAAEAEVRRLEHAARFATVRLRIVAAQQTSTA